MVEVDGSQHAHDIRDVHRDETMNRNGRSVIRVWHIDVLQRRKQLLGTIVAVLDGRLDNKTIALDLMFLPAHSNEDHL
ncbi:very-short-patch-repair endonuclease [Aminobacter ciceronei]|uniref:Very-short-patch-repair endonuclease n=2 Tax=Aminobacter TaxID=31988 RepID=A0ABR6HBF2_AMIAI|nr:very-short-patch-repair endonuclease [Aminobacter ciceronei]MBA9018419.1 very-short-patch-repair endonuclease [Aminobacter ciceronei]MBB3707859.1 very-short-patch-repair endonuclease [Aminobacter aminovorans]